MGCMESGDGYLASAMATTIVVNLVVSISGSLLRIDQSSAIKAP